MRIAEGGPTKKNSQRSPMVLRVVKPRNIYSYRYWSCNKRESGRGGREGEVGEERGKGEGREGKDKLCILTCTYHPRPAKAELIGMVGWRFRRGGRGSNPSPGG